MNQQKKSTSSMQALADELKDPFEANAPPTPVSEHAQKFPLTQFTAGVDMSVFQLLDPDICKEKDVMWDHSLMLDSIISELSSE